MQEAKELLGGNAPDADAQTRGQQKQIESIQSEKAASKKPKLSKNTTMAATAKVCVIARLFVIPWHGNHQNLYFSRSSHCMAENVCV